MEQRRLRGQLIETLKILRGHSCLDPGRAFSLCTDPTRNHGFNLEVPRFRTNKYRVLWNSLPSEVVNAPSIEAFKRNLDRIVRCFEFWGHEWPFWGCLLPGGLPECACVLLFVFPFQSSDCEMVKPALRPIWVWEFSERV